MESLECHLLLARAPGLSAKHVLALASHHGSLEHALDRGLSLPHGIDAPPPACMEFLQHPDFAQLASDLAWLRASGAHLVSIVGTGYPTQLLEIAQPPPFLYVLGDPAVLSTPQLAIVGSRNPTAAGRRTARGFAAELALCGLTITSGLALGIDGVAHEGALLHGSTIAVCGTGLDTLYPAAHTALARRIALRGAVISEFPPGTRPLRAHFPRRNRIISGLSLGTLVVEAAQESGSLITAHCALDQGREVFAVPGSIHGPLSRGCHRLIRSGAKLVETTRDILMELRFSLRDQMLAAEPGVAAQEGRAVPVLDKEYEILLDALGFEPASLESLADVTGLSGESLASMLLILELEGRIAPHPGGRYCRVP